MPTSASVTSIAGDSLAQVLTPNEHPLPNTVLDFSRDEKEKVKSRNVKEKDAEKGAEKDAGKGAAKETPEMDHGVPLFQSIPAPSELVLEPPTFWNGLGVWQSRIVEEEMADQQWMYTRLSRLGRTLLEPLVQWLDLSVEKPTINRLAQAIAQKAHVNRGASWAQLLFLLDALVHNRSHQAIEQIAQFVLAPDVAERITRGELTPRSRRLAIALHIYITSPNDLGCMMLYERAERFSYNRFVLAEEFQPEYTNGYGYTNAQMNGYSNGSPPSHTGIAHPSLSLTQSDVDQALEHFESGPRGGRHSRCLRVLYQPPDTLIVFIYRVLRQRSIAEMERTLFGDEVETIVLKFHNRLSVVEERSTKGVGMLIAQGIAAQKRDQEVRYVRECVQTPSPDLQQFLSAVRYGDDSHLILVELHLKSAPLSGAPALMLKGSQEQPLSASLASLEEKGIFLLENLADIRHVTVLYQSQSRNQPQGQSAGQPREQQTPYTFKLRFEQGETNQGIVRYMAAQAPSLVRQRFEAHMRTHHEITVIPTAR